MTIFMEQFISNLLKASTQLTVMEHTICTINCIWHWDDTTAQNDTFLDYMEQGRV